LSGAELAVETGFGVGRVWHGGRGVQRRARRYQYKRNTSYSYNRSCRAMRGAVSA
jgi:hypothetical protein